MANADRPPFLEARNIHKYFPGVHAVNNVNARAFMLEPRYIAKLTRLADAWRDKDIARKIEDEMFVFADLLRLDPKDLGALVRSIEAEVLSAMLPSASAPAAAPAQRHNVLLVLLTGPPGPPTGGRSAHRCGSRSRS